MNERELNEVMIYIFSDFDQHIQPEKRKLWLDQFGHLDAKTARLAAKLLMSRKTFGPPKVHDFALAVDEVLAGVGGGETWGEAWDAWVKCAQRFGSYRIDECLKNYQAISPIGFQAIGTSAKEWFTLETSENNTFKAQFRQRYEMLAERARANRTLGPAVRAAIENTRRTLPGTEKDLQPVGQIVSALVTSLCDGKKPE